MSQTVDFNLLIPSPLKRLNLRFEILDTKTILHVVEGYPVMVLSHHRIFPLKPCYFVHVGAIISFDLYVLQ